MTIKMVHKAKSQALFRLNQFFWKKIALKLFLTLEEQASMLRISTCQLFFGRQTRQVLFSSGFVDDVDMLQKYNFTTQNDKNKWF